MIEIRTLALAAVCSIIAGVGCTGDAVAQVSCDSAAIVEKLPSLPNGCQKERISASGNERPTTVWARRSVGDAWQDQVINKYGERFARWDYAACAREECVPATLPGFTRCTFSGFPCATSIHFEGILEISREEVREMQRLLSRRGFPTKVDGKFGEKTSKQLARWQRSEGLTDDGLPTRANLEKLRRG